MRSVAPAAPPPARSSPRSAPTWVASPPPAIWPPGPASPRGQTIGGQDQGQQLHRPRQPVPGPGARGGRRGGRPDRHLPGERYRRIARRRDTKRAIVAVGRSILVIIWHLLADPDARFCDLAPASTTPASTPNAPSATTSASSKRTPTRSPSNRPPHTDTNPLLGPGSAALRRVLPPAYASWIFGSVEGSLRGTSCRRENRAIPSQAGLFSGQSKGPCGGRRAGVKTGPYHPKPVCFPVRTSGRAWTLRQSVTLL